MARKPKDEDQATEVNGTERINDNNYKGKLNYGILLVAKW